MLRGLGVLLLVGISTAAINNNIDRQDLTTTALTSAERILTNDQLKCLPRLFCEQVAGGKPGQLRGLNVDTQSLFNLLQYIGLDASASPMLGMGEALLTGLASRGDPYSCYTKYPNCPRDQTRLLYYLNNHRGGFFRGFSRPFYGRSDSESRIVNKKFNRLNSINDNIYDRPLAFGDNNILTSPQSNSYDRPLAFENSNILKTSQTNGFGLGNNGETGFVFPNRRPKSLNFQAAIPTDRLPATRLQFPEYDSIDNAVFSGNQGFHFFPKQ